MSLPTLFSCCSPWHSAPPRSRPSSLTVVACDDEAHDDDDDDEVAHNSEGNATAASSRCPICAEDILGPKPRCTPCDQCNSAYHVECWSKLEELYASCRSVHPRRNSTSSSDGGIKCALCNASTERFVHVVKRPGFFNDTILRREHGPLSGSIDDGRPPPATVATSLVDRELERLYRLSIQTGDALSSEQIPPADQTEMAVISTKPLRRSSRVADVNHLRSAQLGQSRLGRCQLGLDAADIVQEANWAQEDRQFCSFVDTLTNRKQRKNSASTHSLTYAMSEDDESSRNIMPEETLEPDDEWRRSLSDEYVSAT